MPTGVQSGGQSSGVQTGAGKGRTLGDIENGGQPSGTQTGVGTGRTLDTPHMDGQPAVIQTGVGKGQILEKEDKEKSEMSKVTDDQPSGSQTEAGKGGNSKDTAMEQIFAPHTGRSKGAGGCTTSHDHSAISPAVKQSAIFIKLAAMHGNIGEENEIDRKARTSLEMAMVQGAGQDGSSSGGQLTGSQTAAGKGRTKLAAQPVGPTVRERKGGNHDQESKDTPDVDGFMEPRRHDPASQGQERIVGRKGRDDRCTPRGGPAGRSQSPTTSFLTATT
ncbi:hypothetical protein RND71_023349 [Anisodus tanguticus]|uniref:Uncharacterized protein n=1 Tax=Anisodus tanguticus TaxID=243964 RepID=A0AAE1RUZ6_9SOLA|nr:hypothetical protein RND71_023349 [Anisodus tanguticus]